MIAFLPTLGFSEMAVLLVIGILLFGRNLPDVGRSLGKTLAQLRRGFHDFKDQMDRDADLTEVKSSVKNTMQELRRATELPKTIANPGGFLRDLTNEALSSPPPPENRGSLPNPAADAGQRPLPPDGNQPDPTAAGPRS